MDAARSTAAIETIPRVLCAEYGGSWMAPERREYERAWKGTVEGLRIRLLTPIFEEGGDGVNGDGEDRR